MTNTEKVRNLFLTGKVTSVSNSEIVALTGISPHQQVFQITDRLIGAGFLKMNFRGRERFFMIANSLQMKEAASFPNHETPALTEDSSTPPSNSGERSINAKEFLEKLGFKLAGHWTLKVGLPDYSLAAFSSDRNILYAFIKGERVLYIGKSTRTLANRMNGYKSPEPSQQTNINNNKRIRDVLLQGQEIEIFVFVDKEKMMYKGVAVNLAAGLEDNLIAKLTPPWNGLGRKELPV